MSRLPHFSLFLIAAVHLLLLSIIYPVSSSRIYETNDAIVIEVGNTRSQPQTRSVRSSNYGNPAAILMPYVVNPYHSGPYQQQQPNIPFWPYQSLKPASINASVDVEDEPATSAQSKQQNIACGVGPASRTGVNTSAVRIIGGSDVVANSWPFMVGLMIAGNRGVFCGGSLISTTKILTAASCVERFSLRAIKSMTVNLGMDDQGDAKNGPDAQQTRGIIRAVYHKDFNTITKHNDIAVLTFDPPVTYSKAISPVCLPPASTAVDRFAGKDAAILGWGVPEQGEPPSRFLLTAKVNIFPNEFCQLLGNTYSALKQQICAGATGNDICSGDTGGPMIAQINAGSKSWTQIGINSQISSKCSANVATPSIYTNVASFRNWINNYLND